VHQVGDQPRLDKQFTLRTVRKHINTLFGQSEGLLGAFALVRKSAY